MKHTERAVLETLTEVGLAGSLIASQAHLDDTATFRWAGDGPRPGLASLLFAAVGADVQVVATGEGLAVTVAGDPLPALPPPEEPQIESSPLPARSPYELFARLDLSQVGGRVVGLTLEQATLALEAGDHRSAKTLARLACGVARHLGDHDGEAAGLVALGLATGRMGYVETARRIYRRAVGPAARYNEALCGYVLALRAGTRKAALELLEGAGHILGRKSNWVYYPGRGRVESLKAEVDRAVGQAVPVVYVSAGNG